MANPGTSNRTVRERARQAAKVLVGLAVVVLSYFTVTAIDHSSAARDAPSVATQRAGEATAIGEACANFPDMTCPSRAQAAPSALPEPVAPTF